MTLREIAGVLRSGGVLDGVALNADGEWLARGKVKLEGTCWSTIKRGTAVAMLVKTPGGDVRVPFVHPVPLKVGEALEIQFAQRWHD